MYGEANLRKAGLMISALIINDLRANQLLISTQFK